MKNIYIALALMAVMAVASCKHDAGVVIRLDETAIELVKGSEKQLKATVIPADDNAVIEWFSSMPEYVSVSETGLVKAKKIYYKNSTDTEASPVIIYCRYNGGAAECKVTVLPLEVEDIKIKVLDHNEGEALRLDPLQTKELIVNYQPADADIDLSRLEWKTSDFFYVSVKPVEGSVMAVITANWAGNAQISVRYSNLTSEIGVIVNPIAATSVAIADKDNNEVFVGQTLQLNASFLPENATVKNLWSIEEGADYASINSSTGLLTALQPGNVKVKVSAGKVSDTVDITVLAKE